MNRVRDSFVAIVLVAGLLLSQRSLAQDPTFTPPDGWLDSATDEPVECPKGLQSQLTEREYYKFAFRNQIWQQTSINPLDWQAGKMTKQPALQYPRRREGLPNRLRLVVKVLVGESGVALDAVVMCSNAPEVNRNFLALVDRFKFRPTRYKGRELVTIFPIDIDLSR